MLDLLIAGGGPAGLVTALYAARAGLDVEVVEPRTTPVDKACGEGLMPGTARALSGLLEEAGCADALVGMPLQGISYLDGRRLRDGRERRVDARFRAGPGLGVRRTTLHAALSRAVAASGVPVRAGRVTDVDQDDTGVRAAGRSARYLVAADGLHSPLRRRLGLHRPDGRPPRWGLRQHFACAPWSPFVEVSWGRHAEVYVTPVGPDLVGVAVLTRERGDFAGALEEFPAVRERLAGAEPASEVRGAGPLRQRVADRRCGRVLLVGDAAGYVDALTGEGLAVTVAAARALVDCVAAGRPEDYDRRWREQSRQARLLTEALLAVTRPAAPRRALVPAARALPFVFEAAVERLAR